MFIISIVISTAVVGYIASLKRKRLPTFVYFLGALLGALAGAALSFGDSKLFLDYPLLNVWTVPLVFSILTAAITIFADRGKMIITLLLIGIMLIGTLGIVYADSNSGDGSIEDSPKVTSELDRESAARLPEESCPCWDGINNICLPIVDCK